MRGTSRPELMVVTPSFHASAGGAAVYYGLLAGEMTRAGFDVAVVSDREKAPLAGSYHALFPRRCARERRPVRDVLAYGCQNLAYLALPHIVAASRPRTVLLHTGFLNFPGLFPWTARRLRRVCSEHGIRLVADVRDRLLPPGTAAFLNQCDAVIACSRNVAQHLEALGVDPGRVTEIPVLQERLEIDAPTAEAILGRLELGRAPYIFYAGLVKEQKGIDLLVDAFLEHVHPQRPDCRLVVAGLLKTRNARLVRRLGAPGVLYAGALPRVEVLALMSRASVNACVSPSEGLPRAGLEALALGRPALLPDGVPEFREHCGGFVADGRSPRRVGEQLLDLVESGQRPRYPIQRHHPENVLPLYLDTLALPHASIGPEHTPAAA